MGSQRAAKGTDGVIWKTDGGYSKGGGLKEKVEVGGGSGLEED